MTNGNKQTGIGERNGRRIQRFRMVDTGSTSRLNSPSNPGTLGTMAVVTIGGATGVGGTLTEVTKARTRESKRLASTVMR